MIPFAVGLARMLDRNREESSRAEVMKCILAKRCYRAMMSQTGEDALKVTVTHNKIFQKEREIWAL